MKNSLIETAERVVMPDHAPDGPNIVLMYQRGSSVIAKPHPIVDLIIGGTQAAHMMDEMPIEDWVDDHGDFQEMSFQMTGDLALTLYWREGWRCEQLLFGDRTKYRTWRCTEYLIEIEHCGRTTWVWSDDEPIARRIFWEGFSKVPVPFDGDRMPSATSSPSSSPTSMISRTNAVTHISETAPIASPGWDFAAISALSFN